MEPLDISLNIFEKLTLMTAMLPLLIAGFIFIFMVITVLLVIDLFKNKNKSKLLKDLLTIGVTSSITIWLTISLFSLSLMPNNIHQKVEDSFVSYMKEQPDTEIMIPQNSLKAVDNVYGLSTNKNLTVNNSNIIHLEIIDPLTINNNLILESEDIIETLVKCESNINKISISGKVLNQNISINGDYSSRNPYFTKGLYNSTLHVPHDNPLCDNHIS